ncbi:MAG: carotenoid 1,2-hydratase, partial [Pseudomonadota bacterium]
MRRYTALQAHGQMRRRSLQALAALLIPSRAIATERQSESNAPTPYAQIVPGYVLRFPHDEGSHPHFRIEWWYVTGWLMPAARSEIGFQITFFRVRPRIDESNTSAFTARQIMIAHAALSDASRGRLLHDQRVQRAALGLAGAEVGRTHSWIDDWSL